MVKPEIDFNYLFEMLMSLDWECHVDEHGIAHVRLKKEKEDDKS